MKLKKYFTHAHLLYYFMVLGCILTSLMILITTISFLNGESYATTLSIELEVEKLTKLKKITSQNIAINISDNVNASISTANNDFGYISLSFFLWQILKFVLITTVLFLFSRIAKTIIDEVPFHEKNPKYLSGIGIILVFVPVLSWLLQLYLNFIFADINLSDGVDYISDIGTEWIFTIFGLFVLAMAYVFKEGTRLHNEQKLTV